MKKKPEKTTLEIIAEINEKIDAIEDLLGWTIDARARFWKRQRVRPSPKAIKNGIFPKTKANIRGTVVSMNSIWITVKVDGYKGKPRSFHQNYWLPVTGRRAAR